MSSPSRRRRRLLFGLGLTGALGLAALLGGEAWVRWRHPAYADLWGALRSHPRWVRELRPDTAGRLRALTGEYDCAFRTNAQGLREAGPIGRKTPGRRRVLAVGDSNTFGLGVEDGEVWIRRLDGPDLEPVNAGWASGYAPDTACLFLEERGVELEPDLVIQQLTPANDLEDLAWRDQWQLDEQGRLVAVRHRWSAVPDWIQALALPRWFALQLLPALGGRREAASEADPAPPELGLARLRQVLSRERDFLTGRGVPLLVLLFPPVSALRDDFPEPFARAERRRWEALKATVQELGLPLLDPLEGPELAAAAAPRCWGDGHLTASGQAAVGEFVARALRAAPPADGPR